MGKEWVLIDLQEDYIITKLEVSVYCGQGGYSLLTDYRIMFGRNNEKYSLAAQAQGKNSFIPRTDVITDLRSMECYLYKKDNAVYGMQAAE